MLGGKKGWPSALWGLVNKRRNALKPPKHGRTRTKMQNERECINDARGDLQSLKPHQGAGQARGTHARPPADPGLPHMPPCVGYREKSLGKPRLPEANKSRSVDTVGGWAKSYITIAFTAIRPQPAPRPNLAATVRRETTLRYETQAAAVVN